MQKLTLKKKIALKIVGYTNLNLLGKKATLKVYKSKASCKVAAIKLMVKIKAKNVLQKIKFAAEFLKGCSLEANIWTAKRLMRLKGWSWNNYISVCNAFRLFRNFNQSVSFELRVKI